jgi:hypothetical protein
MKTGEYDSWEKWSLCVKALDRLVFVMCELRPKTDSKEFNIWDKEMNEVRKLCISNHERGINLNIRDLK